LFAVVRWAKKMGKMGKKEKRQKRKEKNRKENTVPTLIIELQGRKNRCSTIKNNVAPTRISAFMGVQN
jgi:hypothetical protein